jgi:hypothetical protein
MGTRADFYIKRDAALEWLGSVAWDGYDVQEMTQGNSDESERNKSCWNVKNATTEDEFKQAVEAYFSHRDDVRLPTEGWPWPWNDSRTTDRAYVLDHGKVRIFGFGGEYAGERDEEGDEVRREKHETDFEWPDMSDAKNVTDGGFIIMRAV